MSLLLKEKFKVMFGLIIDERQYNDFGWSLHYHKIRLSGKSEDIERIYFSFDLDSPIVVIAKNSNYVSEFINANLLLDCRGKVFTDVYACVEYFEHYSSSNFYRIQKSNELRKRLCDLAKVKFRFCGPELESLLDPDIFEKASEFVGLFEKGSYISWTGKEYSSKYTPRNDAVTSRFDILIEKDIDDGQKKLASLWMGFVQTRTIIYIGSAPGEAWIELANGGRTKVISVDPRPLSSAVDNNLIMHFQQEIHTYDDIINVVNASVKAGFVSQDEKFDLIWDVRGDFDDDSYEMRISEEIDELNSILTLSTKLFYRINIKIASNFVHLYMLPPNGRFYYQPFCLSRGVAELRYVSLHDNVLEVRDGAKISIRKFFSAVKSGFVLDDCFSDFSLFCNAHLMRLDYGNYMLVPRVESDLDITLYSLNWNRPDDVKSYLRNYFPVVATVFHKNMLKSNEFVLNEDIADLTIYSFFDTRPFINYFIRDIFVVAPKYINFYSDEYSSSWNFLLKKSKFLLAQYGMTNDYDMSRSVSARNLGFSFSRFPLSFSVWDTNISVSGHAMRFACISIIDGRYLISMYIDKIIHNICAFGKKRPIEVESFNSLGKYLKVGKPKNRYIEGNSKSFWHSIDEWKAGFLAVEQFMPHFDNRPFRLFLNMTSNLADVTRDGREVYAWKKNFKFNTKGIKTIPLVSSECKKLVEDVSENYDFCKGLDALVAKRFNRLSPSVKNLIVNFRLDKFFRSVYVHKAYIFVVSGGKFSTHDDSKFEVIEAVGYSCRYILKLTDAYADELWRKGLKHHYDNNPHHFDHWLSDDEDVNVNEIPDGDLEELVCDVVARSWELSHPDQKVYFPCLDGNWSSLLDCRIRARAVLVHAKLFNDSTSFYRSDVYAKYVSLVGEGQIEAP